MSTSVGGISSAVTCSYCCFRFCLRLKEACILLNLMPGSAVLLKETLEEYTPKTKNETSCTALEELGVYRLSVSEVLNVLNSRINWNK